MGVVTWAQAVSKLTIGSAILYILYGAFTNFFELVVGLVFSEVNQDIVASGSRTLFITFVLAELILIFFVFYAAVRVEYDRYMEY